MSSAAERRGRSCHRSPTSMRHTMPPASRNLLYCVAGILFPAVEGTIGAYYASNCYEVGGGNMAPPFLECTGCQYVEAFECLETLRANTSGNVPTGCRINVLTVQPDSTCCPVFEDPNNHRSLDSSTSAYPDALLCLEKAGCEGDNLYTRLRGECAFNLCSEEYACVAAYSGSRRVSPTVWGITMIGLIMTRIPMLLGFDPGR